MKIIEFLLKKKGSFHKSFKELRAYYLWKMIRLKIAILVTGNIGDLLFDCINKTGFYSGMTYNTIPIDILIAL